MFRHNDYRRLMEVRALDPDAANPDEMILEGRAIVYDTKTKLFSYGGVDYYEIIEKGALDEADTKDAFFKYNHSDTVMVMARTKNGTLQLDNSSDGVKIKAKLANITAAKDLYTLVKRGDIDKMSFAFTIREESYDEKEHTWKVRKIDKLFDVAAVAMPAYEDTSLYARRLGDVETRREQVEALELARKRAQVELEILKNL
ncbi:MAG: HK97 family phage prohead protease [Ignavibacteria bacterium]|nr:HK97 family phage prohead protease [Ignavibacteria bacterium]MCU7525852.1 HK97 family phage prohead protease [Ignavibacteria bacterium]